ncbi:MAG: efflux RND transporter periplasmic adaptor subunit [Verrucomicrobia bacterium]|nr:efflux RND transporter periplasmic adaptor subunit [Verrucomicrobiota bacterium]
MIRKRTLVAIWLLPAIVILALATSGCKRTAHAPQMGPPEVMVMDVIQKDVPIYGDWIGTLDGLVNARIHAQVSGYLMTQHYQEGSLVHKGDLLFQIDPRPFQAALDKANGQMAEAQANLDMTAINVKRYTPLAKNNAISQQELDNAIQSNMGAQASLESAQAAVQQTELNLGFTKVTSPIDGIAGIAEAQIGDLVGPNTAELTAISTVNPIKAYFPVSEQEYMKAMEKRRTQDSDHAIRRTNNLELILADGNTYPHKGTIVLADRQVNIKTGTILLAGLFPNPDNILRPGQYAHIRFVIQMHPGALLVPQRAVNDMQGNYQVVVVDKNNRSSIRNVQMGERSGALWIVKQGLNSGERVVVEGTQKVREGTIVNPKPYQPDTGKAAVTGTNMSAPGAISTP